MERRYVRELKKEYPDMPRECLRCQLFLYSEVYKQGVKQVRMGTSGKTVLLIIESPDLIGRHLDRYIERHLADHDVWITSAVKCCPEKSSDLKTAFINECSGFVKDDIDTVNPDVIISLGTWALEAWKKVQQKMEEEAQS